MSFKYNKVKNVNVNDVKPQHVQNVRCKKYRNIEVITKEHIL